MLSWVVIILFPLISKGQSVTPSIVNTAGNTFKVPGQNYYLDWSVAEMTLVNTMSKPASNNKMYVITNGYLQPHKVEEGDFKDNVTRSAPLSINEISVFPNPAVNDVEVKFSMAGTGKATLLLYSNTGQIVYSKQITVYNKGTIEKISMNAVPAGVYVLHVRVTDVNAATVRQGSFKIVKM